MDSSQRPNKLPPKACLEHLQKQAKQLVKKNPALKLTAAQHQIAQIYGFTNWADLAREVRRREKLAQVAVTAAASSLQPQDLYLQKRLERLLRAAARPVSILHGNAVPAGIVAACLEDGKIRYFHAGVRSKTDRSEVTPDTLFDGGSLTKVLTALLFTESERLGKISGDDPASKFLMEPSDPDQSALSHITLLSLATHTSGLPLFPVSVLNDLTEWKSGLHHYDLGNLIRGFRLLGKKSSVSKQVEFSEFGAALLGEVLAAAWGKPFSEVLRDVILVPLGMSASQVQGEAFASALGLRTNARDLAQFLQAALSEGDGPLRSAFEAIRQPRKPHPGVVGYVGLGWWLTDQSRDPVAWHHRRLPWMDRAIMAMNRKSGRAMAVLTSASMDPGPLVFEWLDTPLPRRKDSNYAGRAVVVAQRNPVADEWESPGLGKNRLHEFAGTYQVTRNFLIKVEAAQDHLLISVNGKKPISVATGEGVFIDAKTETQFQFSRDDRGKVVSLTMSSL